MYRANEFSDLGKIAILCGMVSEISSLQRQTTESSGPPLARVIGAGRDWSVTEFTCQSGVGDRPFEEQHQRYSFSAVLEGLFTYKTENERVLMHPGALLFGNPGQCYECGHDHSRGDRCVAFHFAPDWFEEISAESAGSAASGRYRAAARYRFPVARLPAQPRLMPMFAGINAWAGSADILALEETVIDMAETVLSILSGTSQSQLRVTARDEKRISEVLRFIDANARDTLDLDRLAVIATLSKYHFLRTFRQVTGTSPYQYLLSVRMRRAALRLATSSQPVSSIVFDSGFGDLSTFNRRFRDTFAMSPKAYRQRYRKPVGLINRA
jgi:AraC family transcriptional regulator